MDTLVDYEALRHIAFARYEDMKSLHPGPLAQNPSSQFWKPRPKQSHTKKGASEKECPLLCQAPKVFDLGCFIY